MVTKYDVLKIGFPSQWGHVAQYYDIDDGDATLEWVEQLSAKFEIGGMELNAMKFHIITSKK